MGAKTYDTDIVAWADGVARALQEAGVEGFPYACPWSMDQVLDPDFLPG